LIQKLFKLLRLDLTPFVLSLLVFLTGTVSLVLMKDHQKGHDVLTFQERLDFIADKVEMTMPRDALFRQVQIAKTNPDALRHNHPDQDLMRMAPKIYKKAHFGIRSIYLIVPCEKGYCSAFSMRQEDMVSDQRPFSKAYNLPDNLIKAFQTGSDQTDTKIRIDSNHNVIMGSYRVIKDQSDQVLGVAAIENDAGSLKVHFGEIEKRFFLSLCLFSLLGTLISCLYYTLQLKAKAAQTSVETLVDNIPAVIFECRLDDSMTMLFVNREIENLTGKLPAAFLYNESIRFVDLIHEKDRAGCLETMHNAVANDEPFDLEFRLAPLVNEKGSISRNRSLIWVRLRGLKVSNDYDGIAILEGYMQDVTVRKLTELKLIENQRHFQHLADSMPNLLWITNPYGDAIFFNRTWLNFTGRSGDEEIENGWLANIHPEDKDHVTQKFMIALHEEKPFDCWFRIERYDGVYRWMLANCTPKFNNSGTCDGFICAATDITDRKQYEEQLKSARSKVEFLFKNAPAAIAALDENLCFEMASDRFLTDFGIVLDIETGTSLIGRPFAQLLPSLADHFGPMHQKCLNGETVSNPMDKIALKSGDILWLNWELRPWVFDDGRNGMIFFCDDISERKKIEDEIIQHRDHLEDMVADQTHKLMEEVEKNQLLRSIVSTANEATDTKTALKASLDLVCDYTDWDLGHAYLLGDDSKTLVSVRAFSRYALDHYEELSHIFAQHSVDLSHRGVLPVDAFHSAIPLWRPIRQTLKLFPWPELLERSKFANSFVVPMIIDGHSIGVLEFFSRSARMPSHDTMELLSNIGLQLGRVIERFRHEDMLVRARDMAEQSARTQSEFLSNMSHELRTPMHAILNYANMSLKRVSADAQKTDEKTEKYLSNIQTAGSRLLGLLNNLLDLAKLESGKMSFDFIQGQLSEAVDRTVTELDSLIVKKQIKINYNWEHDQSSARFDMHRLIQVYVNLFSNALKFTPEASTLWVTLKPVTDDRIQGDGFEFSLTDEGQGIPEGELEHIFEHFQQSSATKSGAGGTGLGLSIAKQIVDAHKGKIWAENTDKGARFVILLPKDPDLIKDETNILNQKQAA